MNNYVVYHLHTELSLLDSCTNYKLYVEKAKELGQTAICFTEHGNCYHWIEKKMYCDKMGIKYIHGVEAYLTKQLLDNDGKKVRDNYHTILIARDYEGVKEINSLIDLSTQESHFYYKPRITFDEFKNISNHVIKISACLASPLNQLRDEDLIQYYDYLEVQPHVNSDEQKEYNAWLYDMSLKYDKPLIAGTDTHSIDQYKAECRTLLQEAKGIEFINEDQFDLTYKSYDELVDMFDKQGVLSKEVYLKAISNTNVMASEVEEFTLDLSFKYPKMENEEQVFKQRINQMYNTKIKRGIIQHDKTYIQRINEEFRVFKKLDMLGFMLFMSELICWCWENGIPVGPCRGSVGGSLIAYITDIIDVNPMVWRTVFSRFCNEDRKEIGDIDVDISPSQRHLVYEYIINRFGNDKTAYILALGTISDDGTIDEIGRALLHRWQKTHTEDKSQSPYSLDNIARIKKEYKEDPDNTREKYPDIFYYFNGMLGTVISQSMHPAGIVASPVTLPDNYGTFWNDGKRILSIDMEEVHEISLVKYDILGLKNIEIIKDCCELAGIDYPKSHTIDWNDKNVWADMIKSPVGIFQFEGSYAFRLLKDFVPKQINDMSIVNAALRPSGASYRDDLLARKPHKNPSEIIDNLLKDNLGYLIFQEDTIAFLQNICGLSGSDADNIRRAIGRKQRDRLEAAMPQILDGYCNKSQQPRKIAEQEAKEFLQIIEDSSNYQFGFNHSTGYSMIGYMCAMMRYYHPVEFITAYLNNANNDDDIKAGTELAQQLNIKINPVRFRYSKYNYQPDVKNYAIYKGIGSVKFSSRDTSDALYAMKDQKFDSFVAFLNANPCNSRVTEILIRIGFFAEFGKTKKLLDIVEIYNQYYNRKTLKKDSCALPRDVVLKYGTETEKQYKLTDAAGLVEELCNGVDDVDLPLSERLQAQFDYLGYIDYVNPSAQGYGYILDIDTKYSPKITVYLFDSGNTVTYKIQKKLYQRQPFNKSAILKFVKQDKQKCKMVDGEWVKLNETEPWIVNYIITDMNKVA